MFRRELSIDMVIDRTILKKIVTPFPYFSSYLKQGSIYTVSEEMLPNFASSSYLSAVNFVSG